MGGVSNLSDLQLAKSIFAPMFSFLTKYRKDFRLNYHLAIPLIAGQLGQVAVNVADNVMVGKLGASALAGVSFANAIFATLIVFGMGISFALPPVISEADGSGQSKRISQYFKHSMVINCIFGVVGLVILLLGMPLLAQFGQEPEVVLYAREYLYYAAWTLLPFMIFQTLRCYADGMSETLPAMVVIITGNLLNIGLNYLLIFGKYGFPAMGVEGASLASLIARVFMVVALLALLYFRYPSLWLHIAACQFDRYQQRFFKKLLDLGVPTSLQMFFEVTAFSGAAVIMGWIDKSALAAHQISINLATITFMVCTGFAMAATIRVGNQLGKNDLAGIKNAGYSAIIQVVAFMAVGGLIFILGKDYLPWLYIDDEEVVRIASILLICAAIFQIPDGIQVTALSALRGLQDVAKPVLITITSYWLVGIPLSYFLAIPAQMGPVGVWIGLIIGLTISAVLLTWRFKKISDQLVE